jgi:hypothetical protein
MMWSRNAVTDCSYAASLPEEQALGLDSMKRDDGPRPSTAGAQAPQVGTMRLLRFDAMKVGNRFEPADG